MPVTIHIEAINAEEAQREMRALLRLDIDRPAATAYTPPAPTKYEHKELRLDTAEPMPAAVALPALSPVEAAEADAAARAAGPAPVEPKAEKPKRTRATKAKAETPAEPAPAERPKQTDIEDFTGDNEARPDKADPLADGDDTGAETLPAAPPEPERPVETEESKKALALLQRAYARPGGPSAVKDLQRKYGVSRFSDVPASRHAELLADAEAITKKVG